MATYQVHLKITAPCFGNSDWYCEAINRDGNRMAFAYGKDRNEAVGKVVSQVRSTYYNDVDIIY